MYPAALAHGEGEEGTAHAGPCCACTFCYLPCCACPFCYLPCDWAVEQWRLGLDCCPEHRYCTHQVAGGAPPHEWDSSQAYQWYCGTGWEDPTLQQGRTRTQGIRRGLTVAGRATRVDPEDRHRRRSSGAPGSYHITLRRAHGTPLGLEFSDAGGCLAVEEVHPHGAAGAWNRQCERPSERIQRGDWIIRINEEDDVEEMLKECTARHLLKLTMVRGSARELHTSSLSHTPGGSFQ